ncbi:MAG: acetate--CoA ligase family protein, partial [Thauera sp.]
MSFRHLKSLFNPRSIAVIGASARERRMGNVLMRNLLSGQFAGPIMPVNPRRPSVAGVLTYPSVAALPQTPDLAIVCTPAPLVPRIVEELGERGTRAVMVMANQLDTTLGADGRPLERSILEITRRLELRLLGGSTLGILVPGLGLNATFSQIAARPGKLGFVSQRDTVGTMVLDWALRKKVGFSHFVSLGDSLDIGFGEVLDFLAADSGTRAILLYIESIQDRRAFMSAARAAARNKPVIAIKAGRSPNNPLMGVSDPLFLEMPNLVSHDDVHDAALRRAGILRVDQLEEMFGAAETVLRARPLRGNRLVVLSNGGGAGLMVEDSLYLAGYSLPSLKEQTIERLRRFMSPGWNGRNPLEIRVDSEPACYERLLKILQEERDGDAVLLIHTPNALSSSMDTAQQVIATARETGINLMTCWVGDDSVEKERNLFINAGIATFDSPEHAASAFLHMHRHRIASEVLMEVPTSEPEAFKPDVARARAVIQGALAESRASLTESESKDVLAAYGVPVIQTHLAASPEEAAQIAGRIGLPVALTLMSRDIRRKWDVGGVALNLESTEAVEVAARGMIERAGRAEPPVSVSGFTVQRMVMRGHARQLLIGVSTDRLFGPVIVFGEGGRALEIFRGLAVGLPPLNKPLADDLIARSKAAALLEARGHLPAADRDALALTLTKVSQIVVDHPEIHEMDI